MTLTPTSSAARTSEISTLEPFADRIDRLFGELALAVQFDRPSILLAVYSSEFIRTDAEAALTAQLRDLGQAVAHYRVTGEADADIPLHLSERSDRATTVYFVSGLQWGGGRDGALAYRALNIRREYFVDYRMRAVFWLTEKEAAVLPRLATDFWVFRHRVVEFLEAPAPERVVPIAHELAWRDWADGTLGEDTDAKIALRLALLQELADSSETLAARAELSFTLAGLYRAKYEYTNAISTANEAFSMAVQIGDSGLQARCQNSLGNIYHDLEQPEKALAAYKQAIELDPVYAHSYNGLGNLYRELGRIEDAIGALQYATTLDPQFAYAYSNLGTIYADMGNDDAAITYFKRAIALNPEFATAYNNLGLAYSVLGRNDDAIAAFRRSIEIAPRYVSPRISLAGLCRRLNLSTEWAEQIKAAEELISNENEFRHARFEAARGNADAALTLLETSQGGRQVLPGLIRTDPAFDFIRDDPRFRTLIGEARDEQNSPSETVAQ